MSPAKPSNRKLQKAARLLARGALNEAADLCRHLLASDPADFDTLKLYGRICQQQAQFDAMLDAARRAAEARPRNVDARLRLAECLLYCGDVAGALDIARRIEATASQRAGALRRAAEFYTHCGQHEDAYRCQSRAMELAPDDPDAVYNAASTAVALGRMEQAEKLYDRVIYLKPDDYDAWQNRSTLRRQTPDNNHVRELKFVLDELPPDAPGRVPVCYALAKELEDLGLYEDSFNFLQQGASQRRRRLSYEVATDEAVMQQIARTFTSELLRDKRPGHASERPIFILGLPRSGTTLVDRIVSAHSAVGSLGEINSLAFVLMRTAGPHQGRNALIERSADLDFELLGRRYLDAMSGFGNESPRLIDKTPSNFLYLGAIRKALPRAKIIHLRRQAVDSCYAMYKTLFRAGYPFSYSLQDTGRYYIAYHRLMKHWRSVMPFAFLDVDYERLVTDTEPQVRRILEYLGLEWEDACLDFHRQDTPAATASAAQVRQPIYTSSVNRWTCYEKQLMPLARKLLEHGVPVT